jgi:replicative DNA helicase
VCLAQLNRKVDDRTDKKPFLSDLRESGAVEQAADIVLLLNRPSYYDENADPTEFHVQVAKYRQGKTGDVEVTFHADTMSFADRSIMQTFRAAA